MRVLFKLFFIALFSGLAFGNAIYIDANGEPLGEHQRVGNGVESLYGKKFLKTISLKLKEVKGGRFNCNRNEIIVYRGYSKIKFSRTIAHESAHLMNCQLSERMNTREQIRFIDEGLASIIGHRVTMNEENYRSQVRKDARVELARGKVSFEQVKKWESYFGTGDFDTRNWKSYRVGSSFIYFLEEKCGKRSPYYMIRMLSKRSFEEILLEACLKKIADIEREWLSYIKNEL